MLGSFLLNLVFSLSAAADRSYTIGILCPGTKECRSLEVEGVISEAYARIGASVDFVYLPWLRDLIEADKGRIDGCAFRSMESLEGYKNLINIPTPLLNVKIVALSLDSDVELGSPESADKYVLGVRRGDKLALRMASKYGKKVYEVDSFEQLFALMKKKRVDAVLFEREFADSLASELITDDLNQSSPLGNSLLYHVINKKHKRDLFNRLDKAFVEMKRDGTFRRLIGPYSAMDAKLPAAENTKPR